MKNEIEIQISPWISKAFGEKSKVTLTEQIRKGEDLKSLLERMASKNESFGAMIYDVKRGIIYDTVVILVNNRPIEKDLKTKIKSGDTIFVTPLYSGG